jgi:Zn-dependent protease
MGWVAALLLTAVLAVGVLPATYAGWPGYLYWLAGCATAGAVFGSLVLHELAHAVVARRYGQEVGGITLLFLGAATALKRRDPHPGADFLIAGAGPATSLALAGLCAFIRALLPSDGFAGLLLTYLTQVNFVLGLLNLLPVTALDGGRMRHAAVLGLTGDGRYAKNLTAILGRGIVYLLGGCGLVLAVHGAVATGLGLVFLGWWLGHAAKVTARSARHSLPG